MQRNLSREAHLWYTITSAEYIRQAHDWLEKAFALLLVQVGHVPEASEYPPLPRWGGVIEELLAHYPNNEAQLQQGNFEPMHTWAGRLKDVPRGFEEGVRWMPDHDQFMDLLSKAYSIVSRFTRALSCYARFSNRAYFQDEPEDWHENTQDLGIPGDNIARYYEENIYNPRPLEIPEYAADTSVTCKTGEVVPWTGVWVPARGMGSAALAFAVQGVQIMQMAYEMVPTADGEDTEEFPEDVAWHPVKPTGRMIPLPPLVATEYDDEGNEILPPASNVGRCEGGQDCPRTGYWFTPAKADSRRLFKQGQIMPIFSTDYGATIWQWDEHQQA